MEQPAWLICRPRKTRAGIRHEPIQSLLTGGSELVMFGPTAEHVLENARATGHTGELVALPMRDGRVVVEVAA